MIRTQKIQLNIHVVDYESVAEEIQQRYEHQIKKVFNLMEDVSHNDRQRLFLYLTLQTVLEIQKQFGKKNTVFYVNSKANIYGPIRWSLEIISKNLPVMVFTDTHDFECFTRPCGEGTEMTEIISFMRFDYKFHNYTKRKVDSFFSRYHIKPFKILENPA